MESKVYLLCLWIIFYCDGVASRRYARYGRYGRDHSPEPCPAQCRCISLNSISNTVGGRPWGTTGYMHQLDNNVWGDNIFSGGKLQDGRDMVCLGLRQLPDPLPADLTKLTVFGDSSAPEDNTPVSKMHVRTKFDTEQNKEWMMRTQLSSINRDSFRQNYLLQELKISGNSIDIIYPYVFEMLQNIRYLMLSNNKIRHLSAASFDGLSFLTELSLSDNAIGYLPPAVFNNLHNLKFLRLSGNKIRMIHKDVFRSLTTLKVLDLSRNNFTDLYDEVFDSNFGLEQLLLNGNRLWLIRVRWFQSLANLKILSLKGNDIFRIDPGSFKNLFNLEELLLSANHIEIIPEAAFLNLTKLQTLDIATNDIRKYESNCFAGIASLTKLYADNNKIGLIENGTFAALYSLKTLHLSRNSIKEITPRAFASLRFVENLDLSHNKLRRVRYETFSGMSSLKELNLDHNTIGQLEEEAFAVAKMSQLSQITWLSLQFNKISKLGPHSLRGIRHLKFLNLGHNRLRSINKQAFASLSHLRTLLLNQNKLRKIENGVFIHLKMLTSLNIAHNKLSSLPEGAFMGLTGLYDLSLMSNSLMDFSEGTFRPLLNLEILNLKGNSLNGFGISTVSPLAKLKSLDLSSNRLTWFDPSYPKQVRLHHLLLSHNRLHTLSGDIRNIMAASGILSLADNPWSCDCNLAWVVEHRLGPGMRIYKMADMMCNMPMALKWKRMTELTSSDFQCDHPHALSSPQVICSTISIPAMHTMKFLNIRRSKDEVMDRHISLQDKTGAFLCNGVLINSNWVATTGECIRNNNLNQDDLSKLKVKIGHKEKLGIKKSVQNPHGASGIWESDFVLLELDQRSEVDSVGGNTPCIIKQEQYNSLSRIIPQAVFSARFNGRKVRSKLRTRTGKIRHDCRHDAYTCLRMKKNGHHMSSMFTSGSPLFLGYQGHWHLVGLGVDNRNRTSEENDLYFLPLWNGANWIRETVASEQ